MYARLDELRLATGRSLREVRAAGASGTPQARSERDAFAVLHETRLAQLEAAEDRLCFGRIDLDTGERHHIGRLGLSDVAQRQLLVDWRAPAARPFYQATSVDRGGAVLRRHLFTHGRTVTQIEDDVLDLEALSDPGRVALSGEGVLLAALNASRTGRMGDIVSTIQSEQDRIIRAELPGVMVVQGGPGTGKTAVALHRAAYLLYTHRERLERSGVLLVGPSTVFLRYIGQVLPSLGETGVVTTTIGDLLPGIRATVHDDPDVATVKGSLDMLEVLAAAVADRQRIPTTPLQFHVRGVALRLRPRTVQSARASALGAGRPHNEARERFLMTLLDDLGRQLARGQHIEFSTDNRPDLLADLRDDRDVRRELNLLWLPVTPARALHDLYADPARLRAATPGWDPDRRQLLRRSTDSSWTVEDIPLLDELADLLGEDDSPSREAGQAASARRRADVEHARSVLGMASTAPGMFTAESLADRWTESGPDLTVAERAEADRTWTYGHVIIDEAQELSPMAWRAMMRRCPGRSMTIVGDLAQTGSAQSGLEPGARSWGDVLDPYVRGRWRLEELTVTYRTPEQIMDLAADVLAASGSSLVAPRSVRASEWDPTSHLVPQVDGESLAPVVAGELELLDGGRIAVVVPRAARHPELSARRVAVSLALALPGVQIGVGSDALDAAVAVLDVDDVKGLEFDAVVLCEPADLLDPRGGGWGDLYVALTRPTQRLRVVHSRPLPESLHRLKAVG
ncbi:MAG TPA: AAA family ATPase [Candidatus Nanopelagicales bacterium]